MHRINANRVTKGGTSALGDGSIKRIEDGLNKSKIRSNSKKQVTASVKKTAEKIEPTVDITRRFIVASLSDIPSHFERIGTGFYREGHHLWEMAPAKGGFVLTRKHGEDHVLGYDPEVLIKKESSILITDRFGRQLKKGGKVRFPMRGKVATGTIIMLAPGAMDVGLDDGTSTSVPPGMAEFLEEEKSEGEHSPENLEAVEEFLEEEMSEKEHSDKSAGDEFEPEISEKPESDYVGPQSAQTGGIGGVTSKKAQSDESKQTVTTKPESPAEAKTGPSFPTFEPGAAHSVIAEKLDKLGEGVPLTFFAGRDQRPYYAIKNGDNSYEVYMVESKFQKFPTVKTAEDLAKFEANLGDFQITADKRFATIIKAAMSSMAPDVNMVEWKAYWQSVGERVAQSTKIPKPRLTEEEKKQHRKERRKQRQVERSGLPKGVKLPPKPTTNPGLKSALVDSDDDARYKEIIKIYESNFDELEYAISSIDPTDPNADVLATDAVMETLDRIREERNDLEEENDEEMEDELSLDTPSDAELEVQKTSKRIVVSMDDL